MNINTLIKRQNLSLYELSKTSGVPYSTLKDISHGKSKIEKCSAGTVYRIANALHVSSDDLLEPCFFRRPDFSVYKSEICHQVKELGDIPFLVKKKKKDMISDLYEKQWYPECLYLLAMVDYLSRIHDIPLAKEYDEIRCQRLEQPVYPAGILILYRLSKDEEVLRKAENEAIPEFKRFNIIESEIRNVV